MPSKLVANRPDGRPKAGWCAHEKPAHETALGVSLAGRRTLVSMKHVGLNVAADAFVNSALVAVHGGLVVAVADDPGMHSSQNEQDSRFYADFARVICLEPADQQEAYDMTREAFDLSERFRVPVMIRLVTRLAHSRTAVEVGIPRGENGIRRARRGTRGSCCPATRAGSGRTCSIDTVERVHLDTPRIRDRIVHLGLYRSNPSEHPLRLIEVQFDRTWYRYLTNELQTPSLPTAYVVALYWQRWRIEDAYAIVKRLLGLAYFWTGSENGVCLQLWATWLLYVVLVDLTDAVAEALHQPFAALSLEMVYRSIYHFTQAYHRGEAPDVVVYLAANAKWLGIVKRHRKTKPSPPKLSPLTVFAEP